MKRYPEAGSDEDRLFLRPADRQPGGTATDPVAELFRAAAGPATASERAGRDATVAAAVAAFISTPTAPSTTRLGKTSMLSKILTAKAAAAATVAALGMGTAAAAATGTLPGVTSHASSRAASGIAIATAAVGGQHSGHANAERSEASALSHGAGAPSAPVTAGSPGSIPTHGQANVHAQFGLCTAFLAAGAPTTTAGSTKSVPPKYSAPPFQALIAQNGGVAATTTYCQHLVATRPSEEESTTTSTSVVSPTTTAPETTTTVGTSTTLAGVGHSDHQPPVSTGKPAQAGNSADHARVPTPNTGGTNTGDTASGGASATGTGTAAAASGGASTAGSGNAHSH